MVEKEQGPEKDEEKEAAVCGQEFMQAYNNSPRKDIKGRGRMLCQLLDDCGSHARINQPVYVACGQRISIGENSLVNANCTLDDTERITIGRNTIISPEVRIYTSFDPICGMENFIPADEADEDGSAQGKGITAPVTIGDYVWIGGGSIILPGVVIGDSAIIGAGSVVTQSIPNHAIADGNPCQVRTWQDGKLMEKTERQ